jgi:hypothetical protein
MTDEVLISTLLVVAPGFVAMKLFQVLGTQWRRSDWEWTIWSLVAGVLVSVLVAIVGFRMVQPGVLQLTPTLGVSTDGVLERFIVAALLGVGLAVLWHLLARSRVPWIEARGRQLSNSAWDVTLDYVVRSRYGVDVTALVGDKTERLYGSLRTFAREADGAEPWLYLQNVKRFNETSNHFEVVEKTDGILVHADRVSLVRVVKP